MTYVCTTSRLSAKCAALAGLHWVAHHALTVFLFLKADIKSALIPAIFFAAASAPLASASRIVPTTFWIFLHLMQFLLSNQTIDPEEDARNKPHRPIPAKRISLRNALVLRWISPVACFAWSVYYRMEVFYASIASCIVIYLYDGMRYAARHWLYKNVLNALGYASLEVGACLVAGKDIHSLDTISQYSIIYCAGIVATTAHAGDFRDVVGDAETGRKTLPLVHPALARKTLWGLLFVWSVVLGLAWRLSSKMALAYTVLGATAGMSFLTFRSQKADRRNYQFYNVWLLIAFSLPAYYRFVQSVQNI